MLQDPKYAQWMARDGISVPAYAYALNNPMYYVDRDGNNAGAAAGTMGGLAGLEWLGPLGWGFGIGFCLANPQICFPPSPTKPVEEPMCMAKAKWSCTAQCNVQVITSNAPASFPERVFGSGSGSSETDACESAKRAATQSTPRGTYPRHCKCSCAKG